MNINYENWNAFEEGTDQFQYVIEQNPRVSELYERAKELTEASEFKGKLKLSMWVFRNKVWFTVWPPYQTPDVLEQYRQNRVVLRELCRVMESHQADIKTQEIVVYCTLTKKDQMNNDYSSFNYIRNHEAKFQYILDTQPAARELRNQIQSLIDRSIFNGKLECTMIVNKNKVWFTPSIVNTHRSINFVRAYSGLWCQLRLKETKWISIIAN